MKLLLALVSHPIIQEYVPAVENVLVLTSVLATKDTTEHIAK